MRLIFEKQGHRLKSESNKAAQAICKIQIRKRVILSGTPLQNDLREFFSIVDFVNPGLLGAYTTFKRKFEDPIVKGQQPYATSMEIAIGNASRDNVSVKQSHDFSAVVVDDRLAFVNHEIIYVETNG